MKPTKTKTTHPADSTPSIYQRDTNGVTKESGLHIECENIQFHLGKVSENIRWHLIDGFKAWSTLRYDGIGHYPPFDTFAAAHHKHLAQGPQLVSPTTKQTENPQCPFASKQLSYDAVSDAGEDLPGKPNSIVKDHVRAEEPMEDPIIAENGTMEVFSNHQSQTASIPKCPIRFLDQHSPEEVAAYFKNHSHELPRSHELCVRRYQRNEDQIRQLDHKYGNLVNMIQGLGQKHQPMLHTKGDGETKSQGHTSQGKVEAWAEEVQDDLKDQANHVPENDSIRSRDNHFDRPLKEIRVGESPSRPWGISVPQAAQIPLSAASDRGDHARKRSSSPPPELPTPASHAQEPSRTSSPSKSPRSADGQPKMIFTGPVFIGYSPEQITDMLQRTGLGKPSSG